MLHLNILKSLNYILFLMIVSLSVSMMMMMTMMMIVAMMMMMVAMMMMTAMTMHWLREVQQCGPLIPRALPGSQQHCISALWISALCFCVFVHYTLCICVFVHFALVFEYFHLFSINIVHPSVLYASDNYAQSGTLTNFAQDCAHFNVNTP